MKRVFTKSLFAAFVAALAASFAIARPQAQSIIVLPDAPVTVAPNQPAVQPNSTVGIINALCQVNLNVIGCSFPPTSIVMACDSNGDGIAELVIPLRNLTIVNNLLFRATLMPMAPQLPGTAFPLACCGGTLNLILTRVLQPSDDNVFGSVTQTLSTTIDVGRRAPVVISASPADGDCSLSQNLLIPGSCFYEPDGKPNVTSVFAVERGNPANVIHSKNWVILNPNLIDALFEFGAVNAGRTFLIYLSGTNGTSRNLTALPAGAPAGCPLGNEQGIQVSFTCKSQSTPGPTPAPAPLNPIITGCRLDRTDTGGFTLTITGRMIREGAVVSVGGVSPRKVKFREPDPITAADAYGMLVLKGRVCNGLPGNVVIVNPTGAQSLPFECSQSCPSQ